MLVLGKKGICHRKRHIHLNRQFHFICHFLASYLCVLIQNHILAYACAGKERHFSQKRTFSPSNFFLFHLSFSSLACVCWFKSYISTCLCWVGENRIFHRTRHFSQKESFNLLVIFLPSICVCWFKNHILAHVCAGKGSHFHRKRHFYLDRLSIHLSFSCLVPVSANSKSHISTCLCWDRKTFFIVKGIFTYKESFISLVIFLPTTCMCWFKII